MMDFLGEAVAESNGLNSSGGFESNQEDGERIAALLEIASAYARSLSQMHADLVEVRDHFLFIWTRVTMVVTETLLQSERA